MTAFGTRDVATSGILTPVSLNCVPSRTYNAERPHVVLGPIYLVIFALDIVIVRNYVLAVIRLCIAV